MSVCSATLAGMGHLFAAFLAFVRCLLFRRLPVLVWLSSLLCAFGVMGCGPAVEPASGPQETNHECVREVCWNPREFKSDNPYFTFPFANGEAVATPDYPNLCEGVGAHEFIFKYNENAPVANLRLIPLSRPEAWCTNVPQPTEEKVRRLLEVCPSPETMPLEGGQSIAKNLLGQTEVSIRSSLFCDQFPRMAPTPQEALLMRARIMAYMEAYEHARRIANALTRAEADIDLVTNTSKWSLKRLFLDNPGTLEQIQQRIANELNSIEPPTEYNDPILDGIALAGFRAGFDDGQFEVEAKLFAIDAGIFIVEVVALEIALGPLGGAKFIASAVSKGTRAMKAAFVRLGDIPIFLPGAVEGGGGFIRAKNVLKALSQYHARRLENAMFAEAAELARAGKLKEPLVKLATDQTHHCVAHGAEEAKKAREFLAKFDIDLDHPANGVFLPAFKKSPNPKGSIVHATLAKNKEYYRKVELYLKDATSQADALQRLRRIGETLKDGTFFNVHL